MTKGKNERVGKMVRYCRRKMSDDKGEKMKGLGKKCEGKRRISCVQEHSVSPPHTPTTKVRNKNMARWRQHIFVIMLPDFSTTCYIPQRTATNVSLSLLFYKISVFLHSTKIPQYTLKGQSHEIFCSRFFPQTALPGPIRDVLGPFRFFPVS